MAGRKRYDYDINDIVSMFKAGMSNGDIGQKYGMSNQNVSRLLRKLGYTRRKGGLIAQAIPEREFKVELEKQRSEEFQAIEAKNNANACLVVSDREVRLNGTVGSYHVIGKDKAVMAFVGEDAIVVHFDMLPTFIEELKAIGRNIGDINPGCEMW